MHLTTSFVLIFTFFRQSHSFFAFFPNGNIAAHIITPFRMALPNCFIYIIIYHSIIKHNFIVFIIRKIYIINEFNFILPDNRNNYFIPPCINRSNYRQTPIYKKAKMKIISKAIPTFRFI